MIKKIIASLLLSILLFTVVVAGNRKVNDKENNIKKYPGLRYTLYSRWVDSVMNTLTTDQRIAQLFMVAAYSERDLKPTDELTCLIKEYNIGGLVFFQGGPMREAFQTNYYQSIAKTPLLIGIDGEWGLGMRLDSTLKFPRQMMLGAINDDKLIFDMGYEIANQLKDLGIQLNFAPVIDVNNNPLNPVINNRSFGENKNMVAAKGIAYMQGMQSNGIIATAKHFPGHGDTNVDSHQALPIIRYAFSRLDSIELYPFRQLIKNDVGGVMVAHLYIPSLDSLTNTAATLSHKIVTGILKDSLKYKGLIFTDALNMKGVSSFNLPGDLEVKALQAGNDVLVMSSDVSKAVASIREAIEKGSLRQSQIDSSCRKILAAKEWAGLNHYKPINITGLKEKLNTPAASIVQRKLIESALTLVSNQDSIIPLKKLDTLKLAIVLTGINKPNKFKETLSLYKEVDCYYLDKLADSVAVDSLLFKLRHYNLVIAGVHNTDYRPAKNFGIAPNTCKFLDKLADKKSVILDLFATPYALSYFKNVSKFKAILISYEDQPLVQDYSAQLIFGALGAKGHLPVTAAPFPVTNGLTSPGGLRLKYSIPEDLGIKSSALDAIDTIAQEAIRARAMPGCVVLAAKNGVVFYYKGFGNFRYDTLHRVDRTDIYDLASVTKISATLPSVMKLYDEEKLKLKDKLSVYLPELRKTNKQDVLLIDMLTHQARLQPYIPFYWKLLEPVNPGESLTSTGYSEKYPIKLGTNLFANRNIRYRDSLILPYANLMHGLKVANNMFLLNTFADTIFDISKNSRLLPKKEYKYSDMDFYYLYWIIERITKKALNEYVEQNFYSKLGASTLGYLPLNRFERTRIAPTENDLVFRKQVVQGYVHDPGAAMLGGVCGHAGVFSNANDLAKLMQMYLNKGSYGGEAYIKPSTIDYFSSCPFCPVNRRGLGFDRPVMNSKIGPTCQCVSSKSYGHTGFTGTMTWVDPETGLLFIFLSNRVFPDAENHKITTMDIRTRIQDVLAKSIQ